MYKFTLSLLPISKLCSFTKSSQPLAPASKISPSIIFYITKSRCEHILRFGNSWDEEFRMVLYEILYHYIAIASTIMWSLKDN